ncbi:MAG: HAMP domain-containing protein [Acidobacteria bacterium]|nr:HAMP domain-containing protein [Acidobacteriota bacterium]
MTIRRRLVLSFATILVLFCLNLGVYLWGKKRQSSTVVALERAVARQLLVASIQQDLTNLQKQIALISEIMTDTAQTGAGSEEIAQFNNHLAAIERQIAEMENLSDSADRSRIESLRSDFQALSSSWRIFYENFGVNQTKAILELATKGDPLSQQMINQVLPQLQEDEKHRMDAAVADFNRVGLLTQQITIMILLVSIGVAILVAYRVSSYLARGLNELKNGASLIGQGQLEHRINLRSSDELGDLAQAYNEMAGNLHLAREQLLQTKMDVERRHQELDEQKKIGDKLLLNILPVQVAKELKEQGTVEPKYFEDVTIIFTDFVGFTTSSEKLAAEDLVHFLNDYFTAFDQIVTQYHMEKLKTIGDSYMYVGGMPLGRRARRTPSHPVDAVLAALEMVQAVSERDTPASPVRWAVRIGIHTGPVIAGVVGIQKFAFDIWGDSVNFASRMESSGAPNRVNLSQQTYSRVKDFFDCEHRGKVLTKDKKEADMYFVKGVLPSLLDGKGQTLPEPFVRRYRIYFQKEPPAFPPFLLEPAERKMG